MTPPKKGRGKKPAPAAKSTQIELQQRVDTVFSLLVNGCSRSEILRYVAEKTDWGVADRTVETYITKSNRQFPKISKFRRDMEFGKAIARLNNLYRKTVAAGDLRTALMVQKAVNELLGLNAPVKAEITGKDGTPLHGTVAVSDVETILGSQAFREYDAKVRAELAKKASPPQS